MQPIVVIVGRPNAGKSTFFNRVTRTRGALVDDSPGVTRDRHFGQAVWNQKAFIVVDTGGFTDDPSDVFAEKVRDQVGQAVAEADAVVLLLDGKAGISPYDQEMAALLRPAGKPLFAAVNKIDGPELQGRMHDFFALGIHRFYPVSAEHGLGLAELLDDITALLPAAVPEPDDGQIRVAVVGRPNVGKSSLINRFLGQPRMIVSDVPGTTRDSIDTALQAQGRHFLLIDTAGIRRKGRVSAKLEKISVLKALQSLERCHVALVVMDAAEGVTDQDVTVAGYAHQRGCGCILLLNKWDAVKADGSAVRRFEERVREQAKFLSFAPVLSVSALTGLRINTVFSLVGRVFDQYSHRVATGPLNQILGRAVERNPPPLQRGRRLKFYYATQTRSQPPTIVCFVNAPDAVHFSYERYLINQIRQATGLEMTPLRLVFRQRSGRRLKAKG
jgi:GTP-binding protein